VRTPAAWPLHTAATAPPPETQPDARAPSGPTQSRKTGEPLLGRPAATAPSTPSPPSLESILAVASFDELADRGRRAWWKSPIVLIGGLASLGVLVPCLAGVAIVTLSSELPPVALAPSGWTEKTASLPAPSTPPTISANGANVVAEGEPRAPARTGLSAAPTGSPLNQDTAALPSATSHGSEPAADAHNRLAVVEPEKDAPVVDLDRLKPHPDAASPDRAASPPPPAPVAAASPAPSPVSSSASEAVADADRRVATLERERDALAAEVARLERHPVSVAPEQAAPPASPRPAGPAERADPEPSAAALASLPEGMPARVLIRYARNNADVRRQAETLADALKRQGIEIADLRESDGAVRTGISFFYARDAAIAQRIGGLVGIAPARRPQLSDDLMARPGAIELSFSGDSHLAVITTSRKESAHE
jgi:hypothetical protein